MPSARQDRSSNNAVTNWGNTPENSGYYPWNAQQNSSRKQCSTVAKSISLNILY